MTASPIMPLRAFTTSDQLDAYDQMALAIEQARLAARIIMQTTQSDKNASVFYLATMINQHAEDAEQSATRLHMLLASGR